MVSSTTGASPSAAELGRRGNHGKPVDPPLLSVRDLHTYCFTSSEILRAVRGVSFDVNERETIGIVSESGCGKTLTCHSVVGLVDAPGRVVSGEITCDGLDLLKASDRQMRRIRGSEISMIFQNPIMA